ncbi:MAG: substrate-binding domain-containing protein [Candidatus Velthaea sp.]
MTQGVCTNRACANGIARTAIERYPGPGEYCPECGDELQAVAAAVAEPQPAAVVPAPEAAAPFGGLTPLQALQQFDADQPVAPPPPRRRRGLRRLAFAALPVFFGAVAAIVFFGPGATGHPRSGDAVRICRSSITERFAADVIAAYSAKNGAAASQFEMAQSGPCDVTFAVSADTATATLVAHDGIVAVVNPQNPVVRLSPDQVRQIFTGELTDWSQIGGPAGPIIALLPDAPSDEWRIAAKSVLHDAKPAASVRRMPSSADVVHAVVSGSGRGMVGLVAFSAAVPAKVVRLAAAPVPSALSIGDNRYPLTVGITVETSAATQAPAAAALVQYARSDDAQTIVSRDGLVPKKGF